jgi:hypothetical protein
MHNFSQERDTHGVGSLKINECPIAMVLKIMDDFIHFITERKYGAPCVVLVINDNPYGLMVALSYMCRTCP